MTTHPAINTEATPSGTGCVECDSTNGWWFHLRRCATCGHIGCCDTSPSQHSTAHARETGHPIIQSFEPGESWFWNFDTSAFVDGPPLAAPDAHPLDQPTPGPRGRVPADWRSHLNT